MCVPNACAQWEKVTDCFDVICHRKLTAGKNVVFCAIVKYANRNKHVLTGGDTTRCGAVCILCFRWSPFRNGLLEGFGCDGYENIAVDGEMDGDEDDGSGDGTGYNEANDVSSIALLSI